MLTPFIPNESKLDNIVDELLEARVVNSVEFIKTGIALLEMSGWVRRLTEKHFEQFGLTRGSVSVLMLLFSEESRTWAPSDLARSLCVTRASITDVVCVLEREGWLLRSSSALDKRTKQIILTENDRIRFQRLLQKMEHFFHHFRVMTKFKFGLCHRKFH